MVSLLRVPKLRLYERRKGVFYEADLSLRTSFVELCFTLEKLSLLGRAVDTLSKNRVCNLPRLGTLGLQCGWDFVYTGGESTLCACVVCVPCVELSTCSAFTTVIGVSVIEKNITYDNLL